MSTACDITELFSSKPLLNVAAPMVRYSKLQFRTLVRKYNCDLCFSPMIIADSFLKSLKARENEFTTNEGDTPLCVQFAANNSDDFVRAAELIAPHCNGVDLNCGCPQRWAMKEGYGADLLKRPELIRDIVLQVRNRIKEPFSVSVKMRINPDISRTVDLCRSLEASGVTFLTVHSRTPSQRCEPINLDALENIRSNVNIPVIANGDVRSLEDAETLHKVTGCQGVMSARGLLQNPALFAGYNKTPLSCVKDWISLATQSEMSFQCFHHHLVFMLEKVLPKTERRIFNNLTTAADVTWFLEDYFKIKLPNKESTNKFISEIIYHDTSDNDGSYFRSKVSKTNDQLPSEDYMDDSCLPI